MQAICLALLRLYLIIQHGTVGCVQFPVALNGDLRANIAPKPQVDDVRAETDALERRTVEWGKIQVVGNAVQANSP